MTDREAESKQRAEPTVLVVDEDESVGAAVREALRPEECRIITATDPGTAARVIVGDAAVEAVVIDIVLAASSELETALRSRRPALPVLYTTSYPEMLLLDREIPEPGRLVRKPIDLDRLRSALQALLAPKGQPR